MTEHFGKRIEAMLKETGEKPADLSKAIGVSKSAISFWISGETKEIKGTNLYTASEHFGVMTDWLSKGEGQKYQNGHKLRKEIREAKEISYCIPTSKPESPDELVSRYSLLRKVIWESNRMLNDLLPSLHSTAINNTIIPSLRNNGVLVRPEDGSHHLLGTNLTIIKGDEDNTRKITCLAVSTTKARALGEDEFDVFQFKIFPYKLEETDFIYAIIIDDKIDSGIGAIKAIRIKKEWLKTPEDDTMPTVDISRIQIQSSIPVQEIYKYPDGAFTLNDKRVITDQINNYDLSDLFAISDQQPFKDTE